MTVDSIAFMPAPRRSRHDGWTETRQRAFIDALERIGSVAHAARVVGMTKRSAYRLRAAPGAESFAQAWACAAGCGQEEQLSHAIGLALRGDTLPLVKRAGKSARSIVTTIALPLRR